MAARSRLLSVVLVADALLAVGFGLASLVSPMGTFGTIVDLSGSAEGSLVLATLGSLSASYVLLGLVCAVAAWMPAEQGWRLGAVMLGRHLWIGSKGYSEIGSPWLIGDPWPDIVIHTAFVLAYVFAIARVLRREPMP